MRFPLISAVTSLLLVVSQVGASAADLRAPYSPPQNDDVPVELGSGWYIRGDIGAANDNSVQFGSGFPNLRQSGLNGWSAGIGGGYKFTNWFRADATLDYRSVNMRNGYAGSTPCVTSVIGGALGTQNCLGNVQSRLNRTHALANIYADIGTWFGITPYIGAGAGVNVIYNKANLNFFQGNQTPYNFTYTDPATGVGYSSYLDQTRSSYALRFAWAAMAGFAVDITPHIKLDVGYRYLDLGKYNAINPYGTLIKKEIRAQEIRAGIRYMID